MRKADLGRSTYVGLIGIAVGALLTGVVLPLTIDAKESRQAASIQDPNPSAGEPGSVAETGDRAAVDAAGTAPGSDGGGAGTNPAAEGAGATGAGGPGQLSASDVGVSAKEITVGILLFDLNAAVSLGLDADGASASEQQRMYQTFIDEVNANGGVGGRRLKPVYSTYDPLSPDDQLRACTALTEDAKSFAVFATAGYSGDPVLCVTERHGTILIKQEGDADEYYERSKGLLFTSGMAARRSARAMAQQSNSQGRLKGAKIGVVMDDRPHSRIATEQGLIARLDQLGYKVTHKTVLSSDLQTAQSQMPVQISEMKRKGVNLVFMSPSALLSALWFNQAEGQAFRPLYIGSDVASVASDFTVQNAPSDLKAFAYTSLRIGEARARMPTQPESADCARRYKAASGQTVEAGTTAYEAMSSICGSVAMFAQAAASTGPGLTRSTFGRAMTGLQPFAFPNFGGAMSFGAGKYDGADFVRTLRFASDCSCWVAVDQFTKAS